MSPKPTYSKEPKAMPKGPMGPTPGGKMPMKGSPAKGKAKKAPPFKGGKAK